MESHIQVFLNPGAGRGAVAERAAIEEAFAAAGATPRIHVVGGAELEGAVRQAIQDGARVIAAAGGDGTMSSAANAIAGTDGVLLPIPLGTLNHFAQRYGIGSLPAAVHAWEKQSPKTIHIGTVNDRIFLNNASCGFYPHLVRHRERLERLLPRMPAMWLAGIRVLFELPMMKLEIETATEIRRVRTPALWVGLGRNSLRMPIPGDTDIEERVLEIVSGRANTRRAVVALSLRLARHLKQGLEPRAANLDVMRARAFTLHSSHKIDVALDGEPFRMRGPLTFAMRENGLRIFCLVAPPA